MLRSFDFLKTTIFLSQTNLKPIHNTWLCLW